MGELLALLIGLIVVVTGGALIVTKAAGSSQRRLAQSPTAAIASGDAWYRHALRAVRLLEKVRGDDMIRVTIPPPLLEEIDDVVRRFWAHVDGGP